MSTTHEVTFGTIHVTGDWNSAIGTPPVAQLAVYTKTGQARIAELSERDLVDVIRQAGDALDKLLSYRAVCARQWVNGS